ncbi:2-octaprenyl-3-methyl-6-methoxy-1,4-benzoquinol hydroxylase [invertebrate metagenome]|uniref:2-octaprenyl-3-methyl-6-methoxy-1,4-benzoquinol hydroxylase n=1 Tax=invertebrate metagenome TaxID=1711999 RepID=A0A484HAS8_9ZZZZ
MPDDIDDRLSCRTQDGFATPPPSGVRRRRLLGERPRKEIRARVIRVNQAGEYGAVRIYEGQMVVLKHKACAAVLRAMTENEKTHLATFNDLLVKKRVRPTILQPLWHILGFTLGASTALLGEKAAMACTVAIEEVIEGHYTRQLYMLDEDEEGDRELLKVIRQCREDEREHRAIGLTHGATQHPASPVLSTLIKAASRLAIWLSERV